MKMNEYLYHAVFFISIVGSILLISGCTSDNDESPDADLYGEWEECLGQDPAVPALPDYYSNYFAYSFRRDTLENENVGLRIKGEFPYARYLSYNIYNTENATSYGAVTDFEMKPDLGNVNPFLPDNSWNAGNREYSVIIAPDSYTADPDQNSFVFNSDSVKYLTVILRYYVPEVNGLGNVKIPLIEAFDIISGNTVALPELYSITTIPLEIYKERISPLFKTVIDDSLRFYRNAGGGQFNCADNMYLINAFRMSEDSVLTVRLFPPEYPSINTEFCSKDVRYWSLNQGNDDTTTPCGIKDNDFIISNDGYVYVAIGNICVKESAVSLGYNFMEWKTTPKGTLLYRNMLTDSLFEGSISNVPMLNLIINPANVYRQNARNFIGNYAPVGIKVSKTDFMNGTGGIKP